MTAISGSQVNNQAQLFSGVIHILSLELSLFRLVGPGKSLVHVQAPVQNSRNHYNPPAYSFH